MRRRSVATTLVALTAGLAARAVLRRLADRRRPAAVSRVAAPVVAPAVAPVVPAATAPAREAVVLPLPRGSSRRRLPERPAAQARCGDSGGRTKAGAPCGARATAGGRCRHHPIAA